MNFTGNYLLICHPRYPLSSKFSGVPMLLHLHYKAVLFLQRLPLGSLFGHQSLRDVVEDECAV